MRLPKIRRSAAAARFARPGRPATAAALLVMVVFAAVVVSVALPRGPLGVHHATSGREGGAEPGATLGPISPGGLVQPSGPGQTPVVAADSVPFQRPTFGYVGRAGWQIQRVPTPSVLLEGYASRPSYLPGETVRLAVSSSAPSYAVTFWRVSGRGRDVPFLEMASAGSFAARRQPPPSIDATTRMVAAHWEYTSTYRIPDSWPSGVYVARLASTEDVQAYVPFVVRSTRPHAILVVSSALNWQAYNDWGGSNLYMTHLGEPLPGETRALAVSFDRPYRQDDGAGQLFFLELPFLAWIDRQGLDVAYTTDYDLSVAPDAQPLPRVIVFNGHDEYWGPKLYGWLDRHVNIVGDVGLAMLAADSGYWPIQFREETADGPRAFVCLKNGPVPAPLMPPGANASASESAAPEESVDIEDRSAPNAGYRSLGPDGPYLGSFVTQPLLGVRYEGITTSLGRYTLADGPIDPRLVAGTDLTSGSSLGFIAGGEVDAVDPSPAAGGPLAGRYDHVFAAAAAIPGKAFRRVTAAAVWRELPSGGRVFSSGTFYWGWALDPTWGPIHQVPPSFGRLTLNLLAFLGGR